MKASIPLLLPHLERRHQKGVSQEAKEPLLGISAASIDRSLAPYRARYKRGRSLTKPGSILRSQIPISTSLWDTEVPGFVEADTVDAVTPEEAIKDPLVLEFLDLKDEYSETDLEEALVHQLEDFLLEPGSDFTFVGRQRRLRLDNEWYRVDLVFSHRR